jgi:hypothetical protein
MMATTTLTPPPFMLSRFDGDACRARWDEFEAAITDAFRDARFMPGFDERSPVRHTLEGLHSPYAHVVAEIGDRIAGALFRVPQSCPEGSTEADPGWFFVARDLVPALKTRIAVALIEECHRALAGAGFTAVTTNMGTRDGALLLGRRLGYRHAPVPGQDNRWIRPLPPGQNT